MMSLDQQLDRIWHLINRQEAQPAVVACKQFNHSYPDNGDGWFATSFLAFQLRDGPQALLAIDKALAQQPDNVRWQVHKAHTLIVLSAANARQKSAQKQQALALTERLTATTPGFSADVCAELALVLNKLSNYQQAAHYYRKAIDLTPQRLSNQTTRGQLWFNLASVQRYLGDIDAAATSLDSAIAFNPKDYEAYLLRSSLRRQTEQNNHVAGLEKLLQQGIKHPLARAQVYYALAKEHEDLQQYRQSFAALEQGASGRRRHMRYQPDHDIATIDKIIEVFDADVFHQGIKGCVNCAGEAPIFILGLPRTGSTLVERIISQHSEVQSAGELNHFALQMMAQVQQRGRASGQPADKLALVALTRQLDFAQLGRDYLDSSQPGGETTHFIDKLPLNSLYAGLIHLALPEAKIIYVKRHPLDTCYAIYKQLFTSGYPFSYDLTELAHYYIAHCKLMDHWRSVMPGVIYDIAYEDIVEDVAQQAKALIAHCGLAWQAQCSAFEQNTAPSTTASATQVRQGIYKSSTRRWRHYEQQLSGVKTLLEQAGICCD